MLLEAARMRLRDAVRDREKAPWYRRWLKDRAVRAAATELASVKAASPDVGGAG